MTTKGYTQITVINIIVKKKLVSLCIPVSIVYHLELT